MKKPTTSAMAAALALLAAIGSAGCEGAAEQRAAAERAREWAELQQEKREIDAERHERARRRGRLAAVPVNPDGTPAAADDAAAAADVAARERQVSTRSARLGERLVRYLGGFERRDGAAPPAGAEPGWRAAVRLKSDEDLAVAQEWIDRGGDYRRAIEILETQRQLDAGYPRLEQALVRARDMRFVTPERFARVQPGMTPVEVRAALGPVNLREVLRRPAERLEAWYYPKRGGGKAAVYFRYDGHRRGFVVYQTALAAGVSRQAPAAVVG